MGYFSEESLDARTSGDADEDARLDRLDGLELFHGPRTPSAPRRLTDGERDIIREQEADARPTQAEVYAEFAAQGLCPHCGGVGVFEGFTLANGPYQDECYHCCGTGLLDGDTGQDEGE